MLWRKEEKERKRKDKGRKREEEKEGEIGIVPGLKELMVISTSIFSFLPKNMHFPREMRTLDKSFISTNNMPRPTHLKHG